MQGVTKHGLRRIAARQRAMERDIGINPKFRHGPRATPEEIAAWEQKAHEWIARYAAKVHR